MTLPADAITRLSRLLGMTGSSHDGEALNAMRMANALLQKHRTNWAEILVPPLPADIASSVPSHQQEAEALLANRPILTQFEVSFLIGIMAFETLTAKQDTILRGIKNKVRMAA